MSELEALCAEVAACRRCPRLVAHRERVAREKRAAFQKWEYWGRPLPGFGDPDARLVVVGLAPAAHGGNRTGRMFTGDRSGDFLFAALHRAGFSNQPSSTALDDGLALTDCYITAAVRCAPPENKPTAAEFARCQPFLERELGLLPRVRVCLTLGALAREAFLRAWRACGHEADGPLPRFAHGAEGSVGGVVLLSSYHPSQRNTQTGLLTPRMLDAVLARARRVLDSN